MTTGNKLNIQQLTDLWYLRFGKGWALSSEVKDDEWKKIVNTLMRASVLEYHLIHNKAGLEEVYRLKEKYADS